MYSYTPNSINALLCNILIKYVCISNIEIDTSTGSNSNSGAAIAGAVGGVLAVAVVLLFILSFCVVYIWWKQQSQNSKDCHILPAFASMDIPSFIHTYIKNYCNHQTTCHTMQNNQSIYT